MNQSTFLKNLGLAALLKLMANFLNFSRILKGI